MILFNICFWFWGFEETSDRGTRFAWYRGDALIDGFNFFLFPKLWNIRRANILKLSILLFRRVL